MSKKRTSTESDNDEQANERSGSLSQNEDNAKRARLDLNVQSDTTLQHLPIEILELILNEAVVMEVKGLKLAKCAWKEKVGPVISRLALVCSQWSNILTTDYIRTAVYRTLDDTAEDTIHLEVLQELSFKSAIEAMATLKDEIFTLTKVRAQYYIISVYDRDNMEVVKDVIKLPKSYVNCMISVTASNCLYVGLHADPFPCPTLSVLRISKDAQHQFNKSPWKHVYERSINMLSVSVNGGLLTFTGADFINPASVAVHDANDSLQLEVFLPRNFGTFLDAPVIQKSNGNLLLSSFDERDRHRTLLEIDTTGSVVRQCQLPTGEDTCVNFADNNGRILLTLRHWSQPMGLLDSEFNFLDVYSLPQDVGRSVYIYDMKYDSERSVIMRSNYDRDSKKNVLTTFRFTEK